MTIKLLVVRIASFTFLVCPHYTGNRFSCRHENVSGSMNDNRIELEQVVHTYRTSHQSGRLAERPVWWTKSQSSLLTDVASSPRSPLLILLQKLFTLRRLEAETCPICDDLLFKIGGCAVSFLNRRAGKSLFFYMNWQKQNPVLFRIGAKTFRYSVTDHSLQSSSDAT